MRSLSLRLDDLLTIPKVACHTRAHTALSLVRDVPYGRVTCPHMRTSLPCSYPTSSLASPGCQAFSRRRDVLDYIDKISASCRYSNVQPTTSGVYAYALREHSRSE